MIQARLTEWQLLTGRNEPPPEQRPLRAGPLTMVFESGDLRYLKLGGREVIRRIYAAVRDHNWGTVPSEISDLKFEIADQSFRITYTSTHRQNDIHFVWQAQITGEADGTIRFIFDGEAKSTFLRNRIGFCVLHPIRECAGAKCRALYLNGTEKELAFPEIIAPEQPVRWLHDLSGLAHEVEPGVWAELRFEGDAFEMEDQRNWIDASFKTFCTPLRVPYPLEIKDGTRVHQSVTLQLVAQASRLCVERASSLFISGEANQQNAGETPTLQHRRDACATTARHDARATGFTPFDKHRPAAIHSRNLPHWTQEGATYFVTFRLADSLPAELARQLGLEREEWLKRYPGKLTPARQQELHQFLFEWQEQHLDRGHGECWLGRSNVGTLVESALKHFDGERYALGSYVLMPNHVHLLVRPLGEHALSKILHSWKSFTAKEANKVLNREGTFWQEESFDHIVRSERELERIGRYIAENPLKAKLSKDRYRVGGGTAYRAEGAAVVAQASRLCVEQASSLFESDGAKPKSAGGTPALLHRQDACATTATIRFTDVAVKLPAIGLGASSDKSPDNFPNKTRLGALHLAHLRHDVRLGAPDWGHELLCASLEASVLNLPIELAVHQPASPDEQLTELAAWLAQMRSRFPQVQHIARLLVFQDGEKSTTQAALDIVRAAFAQEGVPIGAGTNADLYQLNLQRPPADADFISWSMNPQVHAFDNASIAETPEAAAQQIASVRKYFPGKPLIVSPVTLKPRFNPVATGPEPAVPPGDLPSQVDPRQMSLFGAVWTLAMIKALAEGGVESMTFFETTGWRGVMETAAGSSLPERFPSTPGAVFPLYHVLADIGEFAGGTVLPTSSSEPLTVQSLMLVHEPHRRLLLANSQPRPAQVVLTAEATQQWAGETPALQHTQDACATTGATLTQPFRLRRLNAATAERAMREPETFRNSGETMPAPAGDASLLLAPYELATLDFA